MSVFESACQGAGFALAAGLLVGTLAGARGATDGTRTALAILAAVVGGVAFHLALHGSDHASWPGFPAGAILALPAFALANDIVAGAAQRAEGSSGTIAAFVGVFALVLAGVSLVFGPISIPAGIVIVALLISRRRRGARKYEGLRVLR
jgi:hypothetical protein